MTNHNVPGANDTLPDWLVEGQLSSVSSFAFGFGFVALTVLFAIAAEFGIGAIPTEFSWTFGSNTLRLQSGLNVFFAWDLAAILSMIAYFIFYWKRMFAVNGPMQSGGTDVPSMGTAIALLVGGLAFLGFAFLAGVAFAISVPYSMEAQLVFLILASYFIWFADRQVMRKHTDKKIKLEFKLFVEFVDLPMAICFTVLGGFYYFYIDQTNLQQFSVFVSGAIAFQIIAFNVAFSFLNRFTDVISRGQTAVLLSGDGRFAKSYLEFRESWERYWASGTAKAE